MIHIAVEYNWANMIDREGMNYFDWPLLGVMTSTFDFFHNVSELAEVCRGESLMLLQIAFIYCSSVLSTTTLTCTL